MENLTSLGLSVREIGRVGERRVRITVRTLDTYFPNSDSWQWLCL